MANTANLVFWTALILFFLAVLFELYLRTDKIKKNNHKKPHSKRIDRALAYFRTEKTKKITNDEWQKITKVSHATATRDLDHLVNFGVFEKAGKGRAIYYKFIKEH